MQLAIETTGRAASLALLAGETVLRQSNLDSSARTASTLTPEIDRALDWCRANGRSLGFVSVADGPGSFTGLRIGVTTAKTLCYALSLPLVTVDSLAAIAAATFTDHASVESLLVAVNAYRGQVFGGRFDRAALLPAWECLSGDRSLAEDWSAHPSSVTVYQQSQWQETVRDRPNGVALSGDRSPMGTFADHLISGSCDAVGVGRIGFRAAICDDWADPMGLVPRYLKASAAEEKAAADGQRP